MRPIHTLSAVSTIMIGTVIGTTSDAADKIRRCDGEYRWETTGGTYNGSFGNLTAYGKKSTARNARKAARGALMDCYQAQWDERWNRVVPERCKIGAKVERYEMNTTCVRRKDDLHPRRVCDDSGPSSNTKTIIDVRDGDIKTALEVQVCCLFEGPANSRLPDGTHDFPDNQDVHVFLSGHTWSTNPSHGQQKECNGKRTLTDPPEGYKINCESVREDICKRP